MRKKMIEVAIPLDAINRESAREKAIRHGHPSTLHLWWARRPLAACRAVLFASLVDDPDSDPANRSPDGSCDIEKAQARRTELFDLITDLVKWENSRDQRVVNRARAEIASSLASAKIYDSKEWSRELVICGEPAHRFLTRTATPANVDRLLAEYGPPVLDPFAGGGSIPLEAQRLGLRAYARDLNPVPVLLNKALLEIPAQFFGRPAVSRCDDKALRTTAQKKTVARQKTFDASERVGAAGLAEDIRYFGRQLKAEAHKSIGHLYPPVHITPAMVRERPDLEPYVGHHLTVIAWLWARTVTCPNPACSARTPIAKTFDLSSKRGNEAYAEPIVEAGSRDVRFKVHRGPSKARTGNVNRRGAECLICQSTIPLEHIRSEALAGGVGQQMMGIVVEGARNRVYLSPTEEQIEAARAADSVDAWLPTTELPQQALGFRVQRYGMLKHADLFSRRQIVALSTFAEGIRGLAQRAEIGELNDHAYASAIATYLAFSLSKAANYWSSLCSWYVAKEIMVSTFGLPTLSMVWDFAEANPFSDSSGNWLLGVEQAASAVDNLYPYVVPGNVSQEDAASPTSTADVAAVVSTDPPYYDNIGYANLSDFFYVWLRHCLGATYPDLFSTVLTPKDQELIAEPGRFENDRDRAVKHFEEGSTRVFSRLRARGHGDIPMTVFYAFKQQETHEEEEDGTEGVVSSGWEKMLSSLLASGLTIQGTWPIRTEQTGGLREANRNSLASSIVLVCRPRPSQAPLASRKEFMAALKRELPQALRDLQRGNIAAVDLAQAAIGPGMAIFSRYSRVVEASGEALSVRTALALINQVLDEVLAEQEGDYDADTRWSLKWFEQFAHDDGPFGDANTLATAMSIGVNGLVETGIVHAKAGKVRLLKRTELMSGHPETWDPATDTDIVHWEVCQYLIHALDTKGEAGAAALLRRINARYPGAAETARELAYRLYTICERKKWAQEAMAYNSLIVAWPEIVKLAQSSEGSGGEAQTTMF